MSASASPRSSCPPVLARSSAMKSSRHSDGYVYWARLSQHIVPVLLGAAVILAGILAWIARDHTVRVTALGWPEFSRYGPLCGLVLLAVLALVGYGTACAYNASMDYTGQMVLVGLFVAVAALLCVAFWLFYRSADYSTAFYVMIAVAAVALVHVYFVWRTGDTTALLCHVPLVVTLGFLLWAYWRSCGCAGAAPMTPPPMP